VLQSLPYTVATTLAVFPSTLHKDVIELLCTNLLPVTLGEKFSCKHYIFCLLQCDKSVCIAIIILFCSQKKALIAVCH